jgi:ribosomal protein S27AE
MFWLSLLLSLMGLYLLLFVTWPTGLVLLVLAALTDWPRWVCGACGNRVEKTSRMCPHCRAALTTQSAYETLRMQQIQAERKAKREAKRAAKAELAQQAAERKSRGPKRGGR